MTDRCDRSKCNEDSNTTTTTSDEDYKYGSIYDSKYIYGTDIVSSNSTQSTIGTTDLGTDNTYITHKI